MYLRCPECGHERSATDTGSPDVCPGCGLVFSKWMKHRFARETAAVVLREPEREGRDWAGWWWDHVGSVPASVDALAWYARLGLFLVFVVWGLRFIAMDLETNAIGQSFLHNVNLVFHEAGHVLFRPFGWFMTVLGGSLMQLIVPATVLGVFLFREGNAFGASIGLWWLGQSLMDLAPYINDARALQLPLLGGGTGADRPGFHDWENILGYLGLLEWDHGIATFVDLLGSGFMLLSFVWGGWLLVRMRPN